MKGADHVPEKNLTVLDGRLAFLVNPRRFLHKCVPRKMRAKFFRFDTKVDKIRDARVASRAQLIAKNKNRCKVPRDGLSRPALAENPVQSKHLGSLPTRCVSPLPDHRFHSFFLSNPQGTSCRQSRARSCTSAARRGSDQRESGLTQSVRRPFVL